MTELKNLLQATKARLGLAQGAGAPEDRTETAPDPVVVTAERLLSERTFTTRTELFSAVVAALGIVGDSDAEIASHAAWARHVLRQRAASVEAGQ